jgi:coenzyme PQQ precursor peptide PqqA
MIRVVRNVQAACLGGQERLSSFWDVGAAMFACTVSTGVLSSANAAKRDLVRRRSKMAWKTPKIVEVPVGMEINMYACAARK